MSDRSADAAAPAAGAEPVRSSPQPRRRRRRIVLATSAGLALIALAGVPLYVLPASDPLPPVGAEPADVAYVIGPPTEERIALAEQLRDDGVVDSILVSVPSEGGQSAAELSACATPGVTCTTPSPPTTTGEASLLTDYAARHPADRVVVVTFAPHVARTRFIFDKCSAGEVAVVAADTHLDLFEWVYQYAYQTTAFVKAALSPCTGDDADWG